MYIKVKRDIVKLERGNLLISDGKCYKFRSHHMKPSALSSCISEKTFIQVRKAIQNNLIEGSVYAHRNMLRLIVNGEAE